MVTLTRAYYVLDTVQRVIQISSLNSPKKLTDEGTEAGEIRDREFPGRGRLSHGAGRSLCRSWGSSPWPPGDTSSHEKGCDTKTQSDFYPLGCLCRGYPMAHASPQH